MAGERRLGQGEGTLAVLGLGSCVAVVLYDGAVAVGGLAHVLLPDPAYSSNRERTWRFVSTAVPALVDELLAAGARRERLEARLVGGACMFKELLPRSRQHIGERNVEAARVALAEEGISIAAEEVGGEFGRSLSFDLSDGRVVVSSQGRGDVEI